jgi:hypothetical protein
MIHTASSKFGRRAFLRGLGACLALPTLESFVPARVASRPAAPRLATTTGGMPMRMAFIAFANGSNYERWLPKGAGRDYEAERDLCADGGAQGQIPDLHQSRPRRGEQLGRRAPATTPGRGRRS